MSENSISKDRFLLSVIIPVYNEEKTIKRSSIGSFMRLSEKKSLWWTTGPPTAHAIF